MIPPAVRDGAGPGDLRRLRGAVAVIAKTPEPGRVKTRLSPPLTPAQATDIAWVCLTESLRAVGAVASERHVLLLEGERGPWIPDGFEVIGQRGGDLGERLASGFADIGDNAVVIAMDTPQMDPAALADALGLLESGHDSVIGPATDGGYWLIGLRAGVASLPVFEGVPMSTGSTADAQIQRLAGLGLTTAMLGRLRDVDTIEDLWAQADDFPASALGRLAARLREDSRSYGGRDGHHG